MRCRGHPRARRQPRRRAIRTAAPIRWFFAFAGMGCGLMGGCEFDDEDQFDREIPPGQGVLVVDNETRNDIDVFVDGQLVSPFALADDTAFYELEPGLHRIGLDDRDGERSFQDDVDVLSDHLSILEVFEDRTDDSGYNVILSFD